MFEVGDVVHAPPVVNYPEIIDDREEPFLVKAAVVEIDAPSERTVDDSDGLCPPCVKGQHGGSVP